MNKIELRAPLMVNGKELKELTYDTSKITAAMFCEADSYKLSSVGNKPTTVMEFDSGLHLYLGMMAIIAENPEIDIKDLERVKGFDLIQIVRIGRNFTLTGGSTSSDQNQSEDSSEPTPESSEPQSES